jgi:hypothetical protein
MLKSEMIITIERYIGVMGGEGHMSGNLGVSWTWIGKDPIFLPRASRRNIDRLQDSLIFRSVIFLTSRTVWS